ncbi:hypothetical protein Tco_0571587 [Tanacetum coccineum]
MDDPNITMEEYIRLEEEKARRRGKVYNWETATYDFSTKPVLNPQHIDEFDLKDETSLSECDEEEQNILNFNDLFPFNVIYPDDSKSNKDNDDDKIDIKHSSRGPSERDDNIGGVFINLEISKCWSLEISRWPNYGVLSEYWQKERILELKRRYFEDYYSDNQYAVNMDNPTITMEEYIRLEEEKARRRGKVYNWETATYATLSCEPMVSPLNDNKIDFRILLDESDDEDYTMIYDKNSFSYKIISVNDLKTDSKNDNDKVNIPSFPSPEPKLSYFGDLDYLIDFENEFPAIVCNDALTSKLDFLTEPTVLLYVEDIALCLVKICNVMDDWELGTVTGIRQLSNYGELGEVYLKGTYFGA